MLLCRIRSVVHAPLDMGRACSRLLSGYESAIVQHLGPAILQIEVPVCDLNGFKCVETSVSHRYKYKHLKTALSNIPQRDPAAVNSKVGRTVRTPGCSVSRLQVGALLGLHFRCFPAQGSWAA